MGHRSKTNQSQCSAESGILADLSMSYDDPCDSSGGHRRVGRSDSSITTLSVDSVTLTPLTPPSPLTSSEFTTSSPFPIISSSSSSSYPSPSVSLYINSKLIQPHTKILPTTEM